MGNITLLHIDCMEYMKDVPDKYFDLAIVDPPYGIGDYNNYRIVDKRTGKKYISTKEKYGSIKWNDSIPNEDYFIELHRISKHQIIFGFQFYKKYLWDDLSGVIIHDFVDTSFNMSHADVAITDLQKRTTIFRYLWSGFKKEYKNPLDKNRIHPAEKPNELYRWILKNYAKTDFKIIDTHLGSGSSAIAAYDFGVKEFVGCEIDKNYSEAAVNRFNIHKMQQTLF